MNRQVIFITIYFIFGIITGYFTEKIYYLCFIIGSISFFFLLYYKYLKKINLLILIVFFTFGFIWVQIYEGNNNFLNQWANQEVKVTGVVTSIFYKDNMILKVNQINQEDLVRNPKIIVRFLCEDTQKFNWGDKVSLRGYLLKTRSESNPGGFSEREYWRHYGVRYKLLVFKKGSIIARASDIKIKINNCRRFIYKLIADNLPKKEGGILLGLILGDKKQIDKGFYERAQKLGIAHVFAVSGLHIGFIVGLYLFLVKSLKVINVNSFITISGAILLLSGYSVITGLTPSVLRASIMTILSLLAFKWVRYKDFYNILAFSAFTILIYNPLNLFSIGFQLSYLTTWGLFYLYPFAEEILKKIPQRIRKVLAVPLAAQMASLPLIIYHFNIFSLWTPIVNILIIPVIGLVVPLLLIGILFSLIWIKLAEPFLFLASGIIFLLDLITKILWDYLEWGSFYLPQPDLKLILLYYLILVSCKNVNRLREKFSLRFRTAISFIFIISLLIITLPGFDYPEITFLDVGQGDGIVVKTPYQQFLVIDGGPSRETVASYLKYKGANKISLVVLTHPDYDHINGLFQIFQDYSPEVLLIPPDIKSSPKLKELKKLAESKDTKIITGKVKDVIELPAGIRLQILSPDLKNLKYWTINDASLVFNLTYGKQDILFTGDIENTVLRKLEPRLSKVEVVKVPHHGSKGSYSERFYDILEPQIAVISVGRSNRYGHPHQYVLERLKTKGIKVYRTDKNGAVIFYTDGNWLKTKNITN